MEHFSYTQVLARQLLEVSAPHLTVCIRYWFVWMCFRVLNNFGTELCSVLVLGNGMHCFTNLQQQIDVEMSWNWAFQGGQFVVSGRAFSAAVRVRLVAGEVHVARIALDIASCACHVFAIGTKQCSTKANTWFQRVLSANEFCCVHE